LIFDSFQRKKKEKEVKSGIVGEKSKEREGKKRRSEEAKREKDHHVAQ